MKFLHTADWHLGAKTNGRDRLAEQKRTLDEIESIATHENVDCVIIAGDVFNTATPSAETEELFFETIQKLSNGGDRFVFVLAGNHDDPTRLSAGLPLASKHNIALASSLERMVSSIVRIFPDCALAGRVAIVPGWADKVNPRPRRIRLASH